MCQLLGNWHICGNLLWCVCFLFLLNGIFCVGHSKLMSLSWWFSSLPTFTLTYTPHIQHLTANVRRHTLPTLFLSLDPSIPLSYHAWRYMPKIINVQKITIYTFNGIIYSQVFPFYANCAFFFDETSWGGVWSRWCVCLYAIVVINIDGIDEWVVQNFHKITSIKMERKFSRRQKCLQRFC